MPCSETENCLAYLRATDPHVDKTRIENIKGGLHRDSYKWILEHDDFMLWREEGNKGEQSRLLWIKGDPGKGKTMLLIGIIEELKNDLKTKNPDTGILSFFFCEGTNSRINNAKAVLRGLIYLLVTQQPSLISHLSGKLPEEENEFAALLETFKNILEDRGKKRTYLIIDALDECETDLPMLLDFILTISKKFSHVKWIVSSRGRRDIEQGLQRVESRTNLSLELKKNAENVSLAVNTYIEYHVSNLTLVQDHLDLQKQIQVEMKKKADDTFLWASFVVKELEKETLQEELLKVLDDMPMGLPDLYWRMMKQIQRRKRRDLTLCNSVLSTVTAAYDPLHLQELGILSGLPDLPVKDVANVVNMCGSFLTIRDENVYIIHQSAKEFLFASIFPRGAGYVHYAMFSRSLQALSDTLERDMYKLRNPGVSIKQAQAMVKGADPDPLRSLRYSCIYWVNHLRDADSNSYLMEKFLHYLEILGLIGSTLDGEPFVTSLETFLMIGLIVWFFELIWNWWGNDLRDRGRVCEFLRNKFLYWLEALSLTGNVSDGVVAVRTLESLCSVSFS